MPASDRRYVVLGVHWADNPGTPEFLAVNGKIVVIDTLEAAQDLLPLLGGGRMEAWSADQETCFFSPLMPQGFNKIAIYTGYDPYDVPTGFRAKGVWSEGEGRGWKRHIHISQAFAGLVKWAENVNAAAFAPQLIPRD